MKDLLDLIHDHDLPPKWGGHPVEWDGYDIHGWVLDVFNIRRTAA